MSTAGVRVFLAEPGRCAACPLGGPSGLTAARVLPTQVKRNLQSVSYHIAQYTDVISDLRGKIERLKSKIERQEQERKREPGARDARGR